MSAKDGSPAGRLHPLRPVPTSSKPAMLTEDLPCLSHPAYPGHPLVIAARIATMYPDLQAALIRHTAGQPPEALINSQVPGAGGNVHAALDVPGYWKKGLKDHALDYGRRYWQTSAGPFGADRVHAGELEAVAAMTRYEPFIEAWLAAGAESSTNESLPA